MNVSRMFPIIQRLMVVFILLTNVTSGYTQKRVRLKDADVLRGGQRFQRV